MAPCCSGGFLTTAAALVAVQVAQGRTVEELDLLGAFFSALGDNIELMAAAQARCPCQNQIPGQLSGTDAEAADPLL